MYRRARLRLVAWYAASFVAMLLVLGVAAFLAMRRALDRETRGGVLATADAWLAAHPSADDLAPASRRPDGDDDRRGDDRGRRDDTGDGDADDGGGPFRAATADVFVVAFRADGIVIENARRLDPEEFMHSDAFRHALEGQREWFTVHEHGARLLALAGPVRADGRVAGIVATGRGLAARDRALAELLVVLAAAGGAGVALSLVAGWVLARRALGPLRLAHDRPRAFVADTSHELRAPLAVIRTSTDLLLRSRPDAPDREVVTGMREVADDASALVEEMLDLARLSEPASPHDGAAEAGSTAVDMEAGPCSTSSRRCSRRCSRRTGARSRRRWPPLRRGRARTRCAAWCARCWRT